MDRHIEMKVVTDNYGTMMIGENYPFDVKRTFILYLRIGKSKGHHANRECDQIFSVISGEVVLQIETAEGREKYHMRQNGRGIYVPALAWRTIRAVSRFACVLILASTLYDEADYIRDYKEFQDAIQQSG